MKKANSILLVILILATIFTGCATDSKEIDDQVYTLVLGADEGIKNKIRLTVQYPTYKGGGSSGRGMSKGGGEKEDKESGQTDGTIVTTVEASSILEGINLLNTATSRRISLVHAKAIIFSEKFAREGIGNYLEPIARFRETRRIMEVVVCRGTAEDFIKENKSLIGESVAKSMELMSMQAENTGFFPKTSFHEFYMGTLTPYGQAYCIYAGVNNFDNLNDDNKGDSPLRTQYGLLPGEIPRRGDLKREFLGTAVFDGDKMVGSLNSYETRYFMMVTGEFQRGIITIEDKNMPGAAIPLDIRLGRKPKIDVKFDNGIPIINVKLVIEADLGAIQSRINYERLSKIGDLNSQIEELIKNGAYKTIRKTQEQWGADIFDFGLKAAKHFFTIEEFEDYNWISHYAEAKVNVDVDANVRRTGLMVGSAPIRYKGKKVHSLEDGKK